eukprot:CAMPEP_0202733012 /NCGR_PEP_ID=MMETSP1385-20130828/187950_1 /ASSEMBLY_ACC=CAM_ASM_000861 /TAXON_ID=933848 /ORGANISM="Elphidium margaritaceum" /LENGTH=522 /DNA_ID=CAMNT_0049399335 /DNA_START=284 /DNA_END=1852 /DNA_ORIENTATION=+
MVFEHPCIYDETNATIWVALQALIDTFEQHFASRSYAPELSGLHFGLTRLQRGLRLRVNGYSQKVMAYVREIVDEFSTFVLDAALFESQRKLLIRRLKNWIVDCEDHIPYLAARTVMFGTLTREQAMAAAEKLSVDDVRKVRTFLFNPRGDDEMKFYALFTGNLPPNAVHECVQYIGDKFHLRRGNGNTSDDDGSVAFYNKHKSLMAEQKFLPLPDQQSIEYRYTFSKLQHRNVVLPARDVHIYAEKCISADEDNEGVVVMYQMSDEPVCFGDNKRGIGIMCYVLKQIMCEPFYDALRTKQQLGYDVSVNYETVRNIPYMKFTIISSQFNPHYAALQILKFINDTFYNEYVLDILMQNECEKFKEKIDILVQSNKIETSTLSARHGLYWDEIFTYNSFEFDSKQREIERLQSFTFEEFKLFYEQSLLCKNEQTKCAILQVWRQAGVDDGDDDEEEDEEDGDADDEKDENTSETGVAAVDPDIESVNELKQRITNDLKLNVNIREIKDIRQWQNDLCMLKSYI